MVLFLFLGYKVIHAHLAGKELVHAVVAPHNVAEDVNYPAA
jgi:hypothetical protein